MPGAGSGMRVESGAAEELPDPLGARVRHDDDLVAAGEKRLQDCRRVRDRAAGSGPPRSRRSSARRTSARGPRSSRSRPPGARTSSRMRSRVALGRALVEAGRERVDADESVLVRERGDAAVHAPAVAGGARGHLGVGRVSEIGDGSLGAAGGVRSPSRNRLVTRAASWAMSVRTPSKSDRTRMVTPAGPSSAGRTATRRRRGRRSRGTGREPPSWRRWLSP